MENKEVIEWFTMLKEKFINTEYEGYLESAISALEKQEQDRWISVTERLPEDGDEVFVYLLDSPFVVWRHDGKWQGDGFEVESDFEPTAWRPLPAPYSEDEA